jgi:Family of unknown function (DUF5675)
MIIRVQRKRKTEDGIFGILSIDGNPFGCFTVENLKDSIPAGYYPVEFTYSPAFNQIMPLIDVPGRTAIRIHPANYPGQLLGCIAVGDQEEPDAIDNSRVTFNQLYKIIDGQTDLHIVIVDIPETATA